MSQSTVVLKNEVEGTSRQARRYKRIFLESFAHMERKEWRPAADGFTRVIGTGTKGAFPALANRGICYHFLGLPDEALKDYARAMKHADPELCHLIRVNRGVLLAAIRRFDEALIDFEADGSATGKVNASFIHLVRGDYDKGLKLYRNRMDVEKWGLKNWGLTGVPELADLAGMDVLLIHEQGMGDSIMMARFVPSLVKIARSVTWATLKPLIPLLSQIPGLRVVEASDHTAPVLCYENKQSGRVGILLMDLLVVFKNDYGSGRPYLGVSPLRAEKMRSCLPPGRKVGLAWAGNRGFNNDHIRSMPLDILRRKLIGQRPDITFVSLQVPDTDEFDLVPGGRWVDDFADTAALISQLDAVISVDTAVAHLAGALGIPCALLCAWSPDWRWGLEGDRTHWYDCVRIFRQKAYQDWDGVVGELVDCGFV